MRCLLWMSAVAALLARGADYYQIALDQDLLFGAPDFSFLNQPLTPADRLFARDGHFFRVGADLLPFTADDERVRLFGVNLAFGANFPAGDDAVRIARRLRRLGVNVVRFHHMDSQPDSNPANANSILTTGPYPTFNPVTVERLRAFLAALAAEGIYANLNLHVGYAFRPAMDGVPHWPGAAAFPSQSKPLHIFHPRLVDLQREFTAGLLAALDLRDNPVLAMVEVNNESSLVYAWQTGQFDNAVIGDYRDTAQELWNGYLASRYPNTTTLRAAWGASTPDGPEMLPGAWRPLEVHSPAAGRVESVAGAAPATVRVVVERSGASLILKQVGFSVESGVTYVAEVEMRAELAPGQSRNVYWDVKQDTSPWTTQRGVTVAVTGEWQRYRMVFTATFAIDQVGRFGLSVQNVDAPLYVRSASLRRAGSRGLDPAESLEERNVALVTGADAGTLPRTNDFLLFLADRDRDYLYSMLDEVRKAVGPLVPVTGTQMGFGGLLNIDSHSGLDYLDEHFYIDHYNFPNVSWDGRDWRIRNSSSAGTGLTTFLRVATNRTGLLPYTVSEFNQPWPNTHAAELDPMLAAFGAFQDWDGLMHFAYAHSRNWDDNVPNGFNLNGDWTKFPAFGQAAWLYRSGAIAPGRTILDLPAPQELRLRATRERRNGAIPDFLKAAAGYEPLTAFLHPVRLRPDLESDLPAEAKTPPALPLTSDTGELVYDPTARLFLIRAQAAAGVFGFLERARAQAGAIEVELDPAARGFLSLLVTSLDGQPLSSSRRMLLTNPGHTLRTQPGSSPERPQQLVNYPGASDWWTLEREPNFPNKPSGNLNSGSRPVWMERVPVRLTLRSQASRLVVYPLNGSGERLEPLAPEFVAAADGAFLIRLQAEGQTCAPWYELVAEE